MEIRNRDGLTQQEFLAAYKPGDYERPSVTADVMAVDTVRHKVLLIRRGNHPYMHRYALPGGFAEKHETMLQTAQRELAEETHLTGVQVVLLGVYSRPRRDPRGWVITCAYLAHVDSASVAVCADDDAADAKWFDYDLVIDADSTCRAVFRSGDESLRAAVKEGEILVSEGLAFDHAQILIDGLCAVETL